MNKKTVRDLMLPLAEYAVVSEGATLLDALETLDKAHLTLPPGRSPHRAVLVRAANGHIIGKLGHLGFLKALEPRYGVLGDIETLSRAGLSSEFVSSMMDNLRFWGDDLADICIRARNMKVVDVMRPVAENIDANASLSEAIHLLVMMQTLSLLVTENGDVVGILRLSDLFAELSNYIQSCAGKA